MGICNFLKSPVPPPLYLHSDPNSRNCYLSPTPSTTQPSTCNMPWARNSRGNPTATQCGTNYNHTALPQSNAIRSNTSAAPYGASTRGRATPNRQNTAATPSKVPITEEQHHQTDMPDVHKPPMPAGHAYRSPEIMPTPLLREHIASALRSARALVPLHRRKAHNAQLGIRTVVKLVSRMQLPVREELQLCKDEAQTRDTLLFRLRVLGVLHGKGE
ncbi:hypothetical protein BM1_06054 [Bipolaris maydis]|nr:hypothetical protein BM1_06054 [Bipolaris maydis]